MGYQITFTPTEEKMNSYKPWNNMVNHEENIRNEKRTLISFCLKDNSDKDTRKIAQTIGFTLRLLASLVEQDEKKKAYERWKNEENKELWYCGWEYSHECRFEKDEVIENTIDRLTILADVVKTADYFDDGEKFSQKWTEISEEVDGFVEMMSEYFIHQIIEDLREFEVKDDEEDEVNGLQETTEE